MNSSGLGRGERTSRSPGSTHATEYGGGAPYSSDGWLRKVLENTSDVICVLGADGTFLYVSPAIESVLGYLPEDLVGTAGFDYVHPEDAAFVAEVFAQIVETPGVHKPVEFRVRAADGSLRHVQAVPNNQLDDPVLRGVVVTFSNLTDRVRMEEEVRFQARLLDAVGQAVIATDRQGRITYWNRAAQASYGWSAEEVAGRSVLEVALPEQTPSQKEEIMLWLREGRSWSGEYELRRRDGTVFPAMVTTTPVINERGDLVGIIGVSTDITERKRAGEALRRSQKRFRSLVQNSSDVITVLDEDGTVRYESPAVEQITGYAPEERMGRSVFELIHAEDRERLRSVHAEVRKEPGVRRSAEVRCRHKDGSWRYLEAVVHNLLEDPSVRGIVVNARDVTARVQAEARLRESERRFSTLLSNTPAMVYRCLNEPNWPEEYVSDYALELTGYPAAEFMENPTLFGSLISEEDRQRIWDEVQEAVSGGERFRLHYAIHHKDGSPRFVEELGQGVYDEEGNVVALEGLIYDVTDRERAEEKLREAEHRYRTLVEQIPAVTYIDRADGSDEPLYTSPQIEAMLGYTPEEWIEGRLWPERLHPDDKERILAADERFEGGGEPFSEEYRLIAKDGSVVWVREEAVVLRDEAGEPLYWQGVIFDITERKEAEERLRASEAELRALFEAMDDVVFEIDAQGRYLNVAPTNHSLLYQPREELIGKTLHDVLPAKTAEELLGRIRRSVESRETVKVEYSLLIEGREVWFEGTVTPLSQESVVFVGRDITEHKALEERLAYQALHDPLTDLPNRTLLSDRLQQALARSKRRRQPLAVLFMDLDNFKVINDSLGHKMGDRLLVAATKRIQTVLRPEDTVARLGGDEFVFLLEDTDADGAIRVAERILEKLRMPFSLSGRQLFVTASIGITVGADNRKRAADLLRDADLAMYRAKHSGKSRYAVFEETMNAKALERLELEHGVRRAMERNEFVVHYQPKVSLATGKIVGFEALARWEHPEHGLLLPERFVPLAEETGLIVPIGEAVLKEACCQANEWHERRPSDPPAVCVNLSARQLREPGLTETVARIIDETELDPRRLFLEVTESTAMQDALATAAALEELQRLGVRAILDDFGTGYSSLSYLERFPVEYVKIDRSFIGGLGKYSAAEMLVSAITSLAHALDLKVIAEGVETEDQLERLRGMGCDLAQGHLFSEPLTAKGVANLLVGVHHHNRLGSI